MGPGFATCPLNNNDNFPPLPSKNKLPSGSNPNLASSNRQLSEKSGQKASINDLPHELILQILDYLPCLDLDHFQLSAVVSLSLTNRRLHCMVSERLYSAFDSFFCKPYPFLRTMMTSPHLASNVRSVKFAYGHGVHQDRERYLPSVTDRRIIKEGLKSLEFSTWKSWATDCNDESVEQEILFAAIVMQTPNITSLKINDGPLIYDIPRWLDLIKWTVNGSRLGQVHQFKRLKSLHVDVYNLKLRHLAPIFRLRSLREVTISNLIELDRWPEAKASSLKRLIPPRSSLVEELYLPNCFLHCNILKVLFDCVQTLKMFKYEHRDETFRWRGDGESIWDGRHTIADDDLHYNAARLHYPTLVTALRRHCNTLESLHLLDDVEDNVLKNKSIGFIGSLQEFHSLKHLTISLSAIVDVTLGRRATFVENLPPSLSTLGLVVPSGPESYVCTPALNHTALYCKKYVPLLREVKVDARAQPDKIAEDLECCRKPITQLGIDFIVIHDPENEDGFSDKWDSVSSDDTESSSEIPLYSSEEE